MGCGCGKARRAIGGITSAQTGAPLTPQESAMNAIINAGGGYNTPAEAMETVDTPYGGGTDSE